ncbi:hypothetical protein ACFSQT_14230 [Mesorhizobium calcicola]|uniref:Uncharacterized protein n=1 Tax=Mesorhizobium calcicola TaxID=1300310 RepID=A0ABW4WFD6_9HYPH
MRTPDVTIEIIVDGETVEHESGTLGSVVADVLAESRKFTRHCAEFYKTEADPIEAQMNAYGQRIAILGRLARSGFEPSVSICGFYGSVIPEVFFEQGEVGECIPVTVRMKAAA